MTESFLKMLIEKIKLEMLILQIQLAILLLKEKRTVPNLKKPIAVILHHGGGWLDAEEVNTYHKHKWGFKSSRGYYMGYTEFIDREGGLYIAREDNERGAHTVEQGNPGYWNTHAVGICLMGNGEERNFTQAQYAMLEKRVKLRMDKYNLRKTQLYGHFEFSPTLCPSEPLKKWIVDYKRSV